MQWLVTFLFALLSSLPLLATASDKDAPVRYDLNDSSNPICSGGSLNGSNYYCSGSLTLSEGDTVFSSSSHSVITITAQKGITFDGCNTIGSTNQAINIRSQEKLTINSDCDSDDSENAMTTVYGDIWANKEVSLANIITSGNVTSQNEKIEISGQSNIVYGALEANKQVELENITAYGDIKAKNESVTIEGDANTVFGTIWANKDVEMENITAQASVTAQNETVEISGSNNTVNGDLWANKHVNIQNIAVCGSIIGQNEKVVISGENNIIYSTSQAIRANKDIEIYDSQICGTVSSQNGDVSWQDDKSNQYCQLNGSCGDLAKCPADGASDPCSYRPTPPDYNESAQYEFGLLDCSSGNCTITFNQSYQFTPMVFIMPTISDNKRDLDAPALLQVTAVTQSQASIEKITDSGVWPSEAMSEVSYLVVEPGIATIGGHKVYAGYLETTANSADAATSVAYSAMGGPASFSSTPVILHQQQSRSNNQYAQSAKVTTGQEREQVTLFSQWVSGVSKANASAEKIAYLATEPTSTTLQDGAYWLQFKRDNLQTAAQSYFFPINGACDTLLDAGLSGQIQGLIAKQQNNSEVATWIRRCQLDGDQYSLAVDKNAINRAHASLDYDLFAFGIDNSVPDICPYFPAPLASNRYDNRGDLHSDAKLKIEKGTGTGNWIYVANESSLSFKDYSLKNIGGCRLYDGTEISCPVVQSLAFDGNPPEPEAFTATGTDIVVPDNSSLEINTPGYYKSLTFGKNGSRLILGSGEYWIGKINIGENDVEIVTDGQVVIHYNEITMNGDRISINTTSLDLEPVSPDDLTLIGHGNKSGLDLKDRNSHDISINANWYISPKEHSGFKVDKVARFKYSGAIIAAQVEFKANDTSWIKTYQPQNCGNPPQPQDYQVYVEPETSLALTCETVPVNVEVHKDNSLDEDYHSSITLTLSDGTSQQETANSGKATFNIDSLQVAQLSVGAYITVDGTKYSSDNQSVKFVPERYQVTPSTINMVAGTRANFSLTPLECNANGTPVTSPEFIGEQSVSLGAVSYSKPSAPIVRQKAQVLGSDGQYVTTPDSNTVAVPLDFGSSESDSSANSKVSYEEAGKVSFTVSSTVCSSTDDQDNKADNDCRTYDGLVVVQVRPWTMAICDSNNAIADGTSNSNPSTQVNGRYRAAGQEFDLHIKPIKWRDGLDELQQTHSTFCNDDTLVTQNYFAKDAWSDSVTISHSIATPSDGKPGLLGGNITVDKIDGVASSDGYLNFANLTISEVGSFTVTASATGSHYSDIVGGIEAGARTMGRFYPAYFSLQSFEWNEPSTQGYVNYMDQPFSKVTATAYAHSALGNKVGNYHLSGFDNNRLQFTSLSDSQGYASRIENWYSDDTWKAETDGENITSVWSPEIAGVVFARQSTNDVSLARKTVADGPLNTATATKTTLLALDIAPGQLNDPVTYLWGSEEYSKVLSNQPKVRYGRMALADVAGSVGDSISVPLKVEYFDGSRFVTNTDDRASEFDVDMYCLLSDVTTNAKFSLSSGQAKVVAGENNALRVMRLGTNTSVEQVRLFLRQGDATTPNPSDVACSGNQFTQPWLQFNWRNKGDEDPSTVVTFGAYRGNDRIIFRGEPGLTGQ